MREFVVAGVCDPEKHYMVDLRERLAAIKAMVDAGKYFCISRPHQYAKTTTLSALTSYLQDEYVVVDLDFQGMSSDVFEHEETFTQGLARLIVDESEFAGVPIPQSVVKRLEAIGVEPSVHLSEFFYIIDDWCMETPKKIALLIDEIDAAPGNQVFQDFLSQLRAGYLAREAKDRPTFHSVVLIGVKDVRHREAWVRLDMEHGTYVPWNIASDFKIDMSLPEAGIRGMLEEYEADHKTGMDTASMAKALRAYTSGYPYLVSRLCQLMGGVVSQKMGSECAWTERGLDEAILIMLADGDDILLVSLVDILKSVPRLKSRLRDVLMRSDWISWEPYDREQALLIKHGLIRYDHGAVAVANRIFEMRLYQYFLGETDRNDAFRSDALLHRPTLINADHTLNMRRILERFVDTQRMVRGEADDSLLDEGRERFLTYITTIINGYGTFHIEEDTRNMLRTDVVIHTHGRRYVVELKIWLGPPYNEDRERVISQYLDRFALSMGYLVSFSLDKDEEPGVRRVSIGGKVLLEATV